MFGYWFLVSLRRDMIGPITVPLTGWEGLRRCPDGGVHHIPTGLGVRPTRRGVPELLGVKENRCRGLVLPIGRLYLVVIFPAIR